MEEGAVCNALAEGLLQSCGGVLDVLLDENRVIEAASIVFEHLPLSARIAVRLTIGEQGFYALAVKVRDFLLSNEAANAREVARELASGAAAHGLAAMRRLGNALAAAFPAVSAISTALPPSGPAAGYRPGQSIRIGRNAEVDVPVAPRFKDISRVHAELTVAPSNRFILKDLGSRNGTFVRHQRSWEPVTKVKLRSVAKIRIGQHLETTPGQLLKAAWSMRQR